jgi:hypothetical protein
LSIIYILDDTIRSIYSSNIQYSKNHTEKRNVIISLTEPSGKKGITIKLATPYFAYELYNLPINYINFRGFNNKHYDSSSSMYILI